MPWASKISTNGSHVGGVDDQEFMFVELHFHGAAGGEGGQSGAAVVEEKVFEIAAVAFENGQVDLLAEQIAVVGAFGFVTGFQDDVDELAERVEQVDESVEQVFAADGGGEHGNLEAGLGVAVGLHAEALVRLHLAVE